ncbi:MAG: hypothetical protein RSI32_13000, partial [Clostridia bacterium]
KVKKKLSVGLVVAIILLMLTLSALAATLLWENYAGELMQQERQIGTYASWQASDKELLIKAMVDMNYMEVTPKIEKLFDASTSEGEKNALSDQALLAFLEQNKNLQNHSTSFNGEVSSITSGLLTLAVMGAEETWPAEKRVWWQRLTNPRVKSSNDMPFVNPKQGDITEKEAIAIAKKALIEVLGIPESELHSAQAVADLYVTEERPLYRRWLVTFNIYAAGSQSYVERWYEVFVDAGGNLFADVDYGSEPLEAKAASLASNDPDKVYPPLLERYNEYAEYEESYLVREWSIESKAEYSTELRAQVQSVLKSGQLAELTDSTARFPKVHPEIVASTMHAYGLPSKDDIPLDDARNLARLYLCNQYGLDEQTNTDSFDSYEYYDVTNPDLHLWKFIFFPDSFEGMSSVPVYKVTLHSYTGEAHTIEKYDWKAIFDGPPFHSVWY